MKIEAYTDKAGEHRWRVRAANGEIVIPPEGYKNKGDMLKTIAAIQVGLPDAEIADLGGTAPRTKRRVAGSAVRENMRSNAEFLRALATDLVVMDHEKGWVDAKERLLETAGTLEIFADLQFSPSLRLERRVEEALCATAEAWLADGESEHEGIDGILVALWFLARTTRTVAGKNLIAGGLGAIGGSLIGAAMGGGKKGPE